MSLNISLSCECENLIDEIVEISGKSFDETESAFMKLGIYPENTKTFISWNDDKKDSIIVDFSMKDHPELKWVDNGLVKIFKKEKINAIYITHAI